jgi:hypothetical protein
MPPRLIEAIGYHHEPHLAKSDGKTAMVLHLANELAGHGVGAQPESGTFQVLPEATGEFATVEVTSEVSAEARALGLSHADLAELVAMRQALTTKATTVS